VYLREGCDAHSIVSRLHGTWPRVHVLDVIVLALERKRPRPGPGLQDEVMSLMKTVVGLGWVHSSRVVLGADSAHKARNQPAVRNIVEHRVFLGDTQRIGEERQGATQHSDLATLGLAD
jgi:hypothetical protein